MNKYKEFNETEITNFEARKLYYKNWRKKNKDKVAKHNETFWKKQSEKLKTK